MSQLYTQQLPYYYQTYIGLDITLFAVATFIYTLFNMVNDPLLGYLSDKSQRFTSKWGKRFPFIIIGGIPYCFMVIFLFMAPSITQIGQFGVFFWMLFFLCLSDAVFSLYDINRIALFPDKFRETKDRRIAGVFATILETIGIMLGVLIPVLIIDELGKDSGYTSQAYVIAGIALIAFLLMIPGVFENKKLRERRSKIERINPESFFKGIKITLKNRNFIGFMVLYVCYSSAMGVVMGSIPFFVEDILHLPKLGEIIVIFYIIAVIAAAPFWYKRSFKLGIKKIALIGAILLAVMGIPFLFVPIGPQGLPLTIIVLLMGGVVDGAIISMHMPIFSSVIDDASIARGKRQEGLYNGTFLFFSRLAIAYQAFVFWIVKTLTGYQSGATDPFQLLGLRIQVSIFPLIIICLGIFVFWKCYQIDPEQLDKNVEKLKEINL